VSKYDWSNVPSNIMWISTDANGYAWYWTKRPEIDGDEWIAVKSYVGDFISVDNNPYIGNWKDSLEERPK